MNAGFRIDQVIFIIIADIPGIIRIGFYKLFCSVLPFKNFLIGDAHSGRCHDFICTAVAIEILTVNGRRCFSDDLLYSFILKHDIRFNIEGFRFGFLEACIGENSRNFKTGIDK